MEKQREVSITIPKNMGLAYILWFFFGQLGVHRFYCGKVATGLTQLILFLLGVATVWFYIGFVFLIPLWIWWFVDIFLIPGMCRASSASTVKAVFTERESQSLPKNF